MIQDIYPHDINVTYMPQAAPSDDSPVLAFKGRQLLCSLDDDGNLAFPVFSDFAGADCPFTYLFALDGKGIFYARGPESFQIEGFDYNDINLFRTAKPKEMAYAAVTGFHLSTWYSSNAFCGRCGEKTVHDGAERMMRCPKCGNMIFPKIMPSVIVAVTNGDRILLEQYNRPGAKLGALVAGFTEIGESVEDTVRREVMEECGLKVKNLRFYKSQPWGISGGGLLLGFWCEVDGGDTIHPDGVEIADARWVSRDWLIDNYTDTGISLTGEMIAAFAGMQNGPLAE